MMMFCASGHLIDGAVNESNGDVSILTNLCYIETIRTIGTISIIETTNLVFFVEYKDSHDEK